MLVVDEKGCPRIGEVYALDVRDLMQVNITPSVYGEYINEVSKDSLEENGKVYGNHFGNFLTTYDFIDSVKDINNSDYNDRSYCLFPKKIKGNNEKLYVPVKYLGNGIFLDLITKKMIRSYIFSAYDENGKLYEQDQFAESLYVDEYIYSAKNSRDIDENKAFYMATPLVFNFNGRVFDNPFEIETARLFIIDDDMSKTISKQDMGYLKDYLRKLYKSSTDNLKNQIDLLFMQDEYLAYAENDFRNSLAR